MAQESSTSVFQRVFLTLGSVVLIVASLFWAKQVLIPVALAVLLAFILTPLVSWLQRHGVRRIYAVLLVVVLLLSVLGGASWIIGSELKQLAAEVPAKEKQIRDKIARISGSGEGVLSSLLDMVKNIGIDLKRGAESPKVDEARKLESEDAQATDEVKPIPVIVKGEQTGGLELLLRVASPLLEPLATAGLVLVLMIFMLIKREDLRNRVIRLVGHVQLTSTTKVLDDAAQRISSFLLMQLLINAAFGAFLGLGLFFLGIQYAPLWGILAAILRFVPYIGIWLAASLPLILSFAFSPDWKQPLMVLGLFGALEMISFNVLEPLLFSHSTGVSPLALLVAAAFWTWLWGPIGLLLSTPLTTCLVVLGKYVPHLEFLDVLLSDEPVLETNLRFYQRVLARDQDEATDLVEEFLRENPLEKVYDDLLVPALVFSKRDLENGEVTSEDQQFLFHVTQDILDDLILPQQQINRIAKEGITPPKSGSEERPKVLVLGCPAKGEADELALHVFQRILEPAGASLEVMSPKVLLGEIISRIEEERPSLILIVCLPPGGIAQTRYLCKRIRLQFSDIKIIVGRWGQKENSEGTEARLRSVGADFVGASMLATRDHVIPLIQVSANSNANAAASQSSKTVAVK